MTWLSDGKTSVTSVIASLNTDINYTGSNYGFIHNAGLWDRFLVPAQSLARVAGPYLAAGQDADTGFALFDNTQRECVVASFSMPYSWKAASNIYVYACVLPSYATDPATTNKTRWTNEYLIADSGDVVANTNATGSWTSSNADATINAFTSASPTIQFINLGLVDMSNTSSPIVTLRLSRRGDDGTNDTYPDDVFLVGIDVRFLKNSIGEVSVNGDSF